MEGEPVSTCDHDRDVLAFLAGMLLPTPVVLFLAVAITLAWVAVRIGGQ